MNKKDFKRLSELQFELWKFCNDEFCRQQARERKRKEKKQGEIKNAKREIKKLHL